jgi:biotin carboxylase
MAVQAVSHIVVGFGSGLLAELDKVLPQGTVCVLEDRDVIAARNVRARLAAFRCVAELVEAPTQQEQGLDDLVAALPMLPAAGVRAVLPAVEYGVVAAAAIAEAAPLPGAGVGAARILRDKIRLREAAALSGLPQARWAEASGPDDVRSFRADHNGQCVLKPANRQASVGVQLLGPDDDLSLAWAHTVAADEPQMRGKTATPCRYVVEQRLHGPEVSVEVLVSSGELLAGNVTAKAVTPGRYPVESGHVVPAAIDGATRDRLLAANQALVEAIGFGSGVLHSEWILVGGTEPHLVECAGRLPGDNIVTLIDLAYGGSLVADLVDVLEGCRPARSAAPIGGVAVRFLAAASGTVAAVRGSEQAYASDGIYDVVVSLGPGADVPPHDLLLGPARVCHRHWG